MTRHAEKWQTCCLAWLKIQDWGSLSSSAHLFSSTSRVQKCHTGVVANADYRYLQYLLWPIKPFFMLCSGNSSAPAPIPHEVQPSASYTSASWTLNRIRTACLNDKRNSLIGYNTFLLKTCLDYAPIKHLIGIQLMNLVGGSTSYSGDGYICGLHAIIPSTCIILYAALQHMYQIATKSPLWILLSNRLTIHWTKWNMTSYNRDLNI